MARRWVIWASIFAVLFCGLSSVSITPAKIIAAAVSNVVSALANSGPKTVSSRSMIKFEAGYVVETVFDGSKLGIEPYSAAVTPDGELLILDAENSNIHKIPTPFSQYCRAKLQAGSSEGYSGHVDGKLRDARMSHPKGLTVDDRGNIYIADTKNMVIRKISDTEVTTIAGGKWRRSGHVDGPSEDAKFSYDFDVIYVRSTCSLLVIDRGNQAIREIQLHPHDCSNKYDPNFLLGMAVLSAAGFLGYLVARLQQRVSSIFSSKNDSRGESNKVAYQRPQRSVRQAFIPSEEEEYEPGENIICSLCKLFLNTSSFAAEIFMGFLLGTGQNPASDRIHRHYRVNKHLQSRLNMSEAESFEFPHNHQPPPPTADNPYPYMARKLEKSHRFPQSWADNGGEERQWEEEQHHGAELYCNKRCEMNDVIFGEVQIEEPLHS